MARVIFLVIVFLLYCLTGSAGSMVHAEGLDDLAVIKEISLQYMDSWYRGDAKRMEESLHPELAKRSMRAGSDGKKKLRHTTASDMISYTKGGYGKDLWQDNSSIEVVVMDLYKNIASVKVIAPHYWEYLHLVKIDEKWVIVNTLYENR